MLTDLPRDVLERILECAQCSSTPAEFARLSRVSSSVHLVVDALLTRHAVFSTTGAARAFQAKLENGTRAASEVRTLVLRRSDLASQPGRGTRRTRAAKADESCSEEDLLQLCTIFDRLEGLCLEEPAFTTLKRRQLGFASRLSSLRALSIAGSGAGFNLHTVGQILQDLPQLEDLRLAAIQAFPAALKALPRPKCRLRRFTLHSSPAPSPQQLEWLLAASIDADSLRHLAFDLADIPPSRLGGLRWAATPVRSLHLITNNACVLEKLAQHFPSISTYTFSTNSTPEPLLLLSSCGTSVNFQQLVDRSAGQGGVRPFELANALLYLRRRGQLASLRRIVLPSLRRFDPAFPILVDVCRCLGIGCDTLPVEHTTPR